MIFFFFNPEVNLAAIQKFKETMNFSTLENSEIYIKTNDILYN